MLRYLRHHLFYRLMRPFSVMTRRRRMRRFEAFLASCGDGKLRVLDLGGQPHIWQTVERPLEITLLNLPGAFWQPVSSHHDFIYVEGDACNVHQYGDQSFDIVFSNSVIEHVGDERKQAAFAREVVRLSRRFWVQTPSKYFPIEAHNGMPFWWFYPKSLRQKLINRWRTRLPEWTEMIEGTRVLTRSRLATLFPSALIRTERVLGFAKSYTVSSQ